MEDTKKQKAISKSTSTLISNIDNLEDLQLAIMFLADGLGDTAKRLASLRIVDLNSREDGMANDDPLSDYKAFKLVRQHLACAVDALQLIKKKNASS